MDQIVAKLSPANQQEIITDIISHYQRSGHTFVNFLYFANVAHYRLFEAVSPYRSVLLASDFLLPDGIALQLWSKLAEKKILHNLNGTDLTPLMLEYLNAHKKTSLYIYSLYDPKIGKGEEWLHKGVEIIKNRYPHVHIKFIYQSLYTNRGTDFPFDEVKKISEADDAEVKLFLNGIGSPFQELWSAEYVSFFENCGFLLMNVGGFLDFLSGFEKRAPRWMVKARVLETFRRICQHPRKNLKKFLAMFGVFRILSKKKRLKN